MAEFLQRLRQRKLVQWAIAYVAFAFALIQVVDVVADSYGWSHLTMHLAFGALGLGFIVMLVLAWYHGERGMQRVSGPELLLITLALVIGGGLLWHFARLAPTPPATQAISIHGTSTATTTPRAVPIAKPTAAAIAAQPIPAKSIAVLPFENLSIDKGNAYFADGMQDLILTKLADIGDLKVISRTSTEKYKSHPDDLKTIGQQLGVAAILEGSVQKAGNQVLINVQLIDVKTDSHIWAQSYQRTLNNIFGVEGEVAGKIADALQAKLSPAQTVRLAAVPTLNQAAMELFLRAEYASRKATTNSDTDDYKAAIPLFRQAIRNDPGFALAYAHLSIAEGRLAWWGGGGLDVQRLNQQARADAEQALKLAPDASDSRLALGYSDYYGRHDFAAALKVFAAALTVQPNNADALAARGYIERRLGHFEDSIITLQQAFTLNPRDSQLAFAVGRSYACLSRYPEAMQWFRRATAIDPTNVTAQAAYAHAIALHTGDIARALRTAQGEAPQLVNQREQLLQLQRDYAAALTLLDSIPSSFSTKAVGESKLLVEANLYRLMGDAARARPLYQQAVAVAQANVRQTQGLYLPYAWLELADAELGLGQVEPGLHAVAKALAIARQQGDHESIPAVMQEGAALYAEAHRPDLAVPLLVKALASPGIGIVYSPVLLWLDPVWDPIRHDPGFQVLLKKYAKHKPAAIYPPSPATSSLPSAVTMLK